jgi:hypothetical protein
MGGACDHDDVYGLPRGGPQFCRQIFLGGRGVPVKAELDGRIDRFGGASLYRVRASFRLVRAGEAGADAVMVGANIHDEAALSRAVHGLAGKVSPDEAKGWRIRLISAGAADALFDAAARGGCGCDCGDASGVPGWLQLGLAAKAGGKFEWSDAVPAQLAAKTDPVTEQPVKQQTGFVTWNCQSDWYGFWPWNHITLCDGLCTAATPTCSCNRAKSGHCRGWWYCSCK